MRICSRPIASLILLLLASCPVPAQESVSPKEANARAFIEAGVWGGPLVFSGRAIPPIKLVPEEAIVAHLGPYHLSATYYNRDARPELSASLPGPYAALLEVKPAKARPSRRMLTLFRLSEPIADETKFSAEQLPALAEAAGVDPRVMTQQQELVLSVLKDRPWSECANDTRVSELLAGLALSTAGDTPPRKNLDALAAQRQWWVNVKRRHYELDKQFELPVVAPKMEAGLNAPIVHAGTLEAAGMKPGADKNIDKVLTAWAKDTDEAFAVCVVRKGVIVLHKAYGTRDGQPMTVDTKSWMASITKSMSATLMMMLVDQGLVDLDKPVDDYVPELKHINVPVPLTIRHLYTHTNGLEKWPGWSDDGAGVEARIADAYPFVKVGQVWGYNGLGYTLGGKIIENVSGEAIPQFYVKHLLDPLDMPHTDVLGTHADARSVPLDIARFGQMLLNRGAYGNLRFMQPETFDKMLPQKLITTLGRDATKTFGIGLDGQPGTGRFGHGAASAATFQIDQQDELVVVMTRNKIGTNYDKYHGKFMDAVRAGIKK